MCTGFDTGNSSVHTSKIQEAAASTPPPKDTPPPVRTTPFGHLRFEHRRVQQEKMCDVKYPNATLDMLKGTLAFRGVRKVAIVAVLKDCYDQLKSIEKAIYQVAEVLSPENVFVSLLESGSDVDEGTPHLLNSMSNRLQALGVSNVVSTGETRTSAVWKKHEVGSRINFLARLRNAAMIPALDGHPKGYFDQVFFVNDVFICGGDILRLLAHNADMACGSDYADAGVLYDIWINSNWVFTEYTPEMFEADKAAVPPNTAARNVFACWNGGMATNAALWYNGVRFREGMKELGTGDCYQSESSLWPMDAHTLGYHNVVLDTTVQVAYSWSIYADAFHDSSPENKTIVVSPNVASLGVDLSDISYRCCEIEGSKRGVDFRACHTRKLRSPGKDVCLANTMRCLRYSPTRWVEDWNWKPLLKIGNKTLLQDKSIFFQIELE